MPTNSTSVVRSPGRDAGDPRCRRGRRRRLPTIPAAPWTPAMLNRRGRTRSDRMGARHCAELAETVHGMYFAAWPSGPSVTPKPSTPAGADRRGRDRDQPSPALLQGSCCAWGSPLSVYWDRCDTAGRTRWHHRDRLLDRRGPRPGRVDQWPPAPALGTIRTKAHAADVVTEVGRGGGTPRARGDRRVLPRPPGRGRVGRPPEEPPSVWCTLDPVDGTTSTSRQPPAVDLDELALAVDDRPLVRCGLPALVGAVYLTAEVWAPPQRTSRWRSVAPTGSPGERC